MAEDDIVIVNEDDECAGAMEKMLAHRIGALHRAFSVVLFDGSGNMLIQQRSRNKYHSPLLWANACCSHQRAGELLEDAVSRRLYEELGITGVPLTEAFTLRYRCQFANSLIENEIDHVYTGFYSGPVQINHDEIEQVDWVGLDMLKKAVQGSKAYAYWFKLIVQKIIETGSAVELCK